jgi:hypothetical protein
MSERRQCWRPKLPGPRLERLRPNQPAQRADRILYEPKAEALAAHFLGQNVRTRSACTRRFLAACELKAALTTVSTEFKMIRARRRQTNVSSCSEGPSDIAVELRPNRRAKTPASASISSSVISLT